MSCGLFIGFHYETLDQFIIRIPLYEWWGGGWYVVHPFFWYNGSNHYLQ